MREQIYRTREDEQDEGDVNAGGDFPHQCDKHVTETGVISMNSHQLQDILKKCRFNWFTFVDVVKEMLHDLNLEAVEQLLLDFAG